MQKETDVSHMPTDSASWLTSGKHFEQNPTRCVALCTDSMSRMDLDDFRAGRERAHGGVSKRLDDSRDSRVVERGRRQRHRVERDRTRRIDREPAAGFWRNGRAPFPGTRRTRFAPCMRELHSEDRALRAHELADAREHLGLLVLPEAEVLWTDAALGKHCGCFGEHDRRAADSELPEMHEVPIVRESVVARVLTHRRYNDSVAQRDAAQVEGTE